MIISAIFLNESAGPVEAFAALMSVVGVILVSNPTLDPRAFLSDSPEFTLACAAALGAALAAASVMCLLRKIGRRIDFRVMVLSTGCCVGFYGFMLGGADMANLEILRDDPAALTVMLLGCCLGFMSACCMNSAFAYCPAATGPLIRNVDVPIAYVMGVVFLGEIPYAVAVAGSVLVLGGAGIIGCRKLLAAR